MLGCVGVLVVCNTGVCLRGNVALLWCGVLRSCLPFCDLGMLAVVPQCFLLMIALFWCACAVHWCKATV